MRSRSAGDGEDATAGFPAVEALVGQRIRHFRTEKGLSLRGLADLTGLSIGFLSQLERGLCSISLTALRDLSASLGQPMADFFAAGDDLERLDGEPTVFTLRRAEEGPGETYVSGQRTYHLLSGRAAGLLLEPMLVHVAPGGEVEEEYGHAGEEFAYVLRGELLYTVDGTEYRLRPGDSVHLRSTVPHRLHNDTDDVTTVVSVVTPRLF